jgi:hypothetical protein
MDDREKLSLPSDVEAFVAEVEWRANAATPGPWLGVYPDMLPNDDFPSQRIKCVDGVREATGLDHEFMRRARTDVPRLVAIIRGQGVENAALRQSVADLRDEIARESTDAGEAIRTANALRERLAKLESLGRRVVAHYVPDSDCMCEACVIGREFATMLEGGAS